MSYKKALAHLNNVTISDYSPRNPGEVEARSEWKELEFNDAFWLRERTALVEKLAQEHTEVWVRRAVYGRARLFVKNS